MADQYIELENVQVGAHGSLSGRVKTSHQALYDELFTEMDEHFNNEQMITTLNHSPKQNEICVGKSGRDKRWYRVRVKDVLSMKAGPHASCYLLDFGRVEMVSINCLYQMPSCFVSLPFQIHQFTLHDIQPLSLRISPDDLHVSNRPVKSWDSAAVKFMADRIHECTSFKAHVLGETADGVLSIRLYLQLRTRLECLNEVLVQQRFATGRSLDSEPSESVVRDSKPRRTIKDEFLKLRLKNKDQATVCHTDYDAIAYNSEPEPSCKHRGSFSDVGYTTDTQGLTIPHRRRYKDTTPSTADRLVYNPPNDSVFQPRTSSVAPSCVSSGSEQDTHSLSSNVHVSDTASSNNVKPSVPDSSVFSSHQHISDMGGNSAYSDSENFQIKHSVLKTSPNLAMNVSSPLSRGTPPPLSPGCGRGLGYLSSPSPARPGSSSSPEVNPRSKAVRSLDKLLNSADKADGTLGDKHVSCVSDSDRLSRRRILDGYSSGESGLGRGAVLKKLPNDQVSVSQKTNTCSSTAPKDYSFDEQFSNSDSDALLPQRCARTSRHPPGCGYGQSGGRASTGSTRDCSSGNESAGRNILVNSILGEIDFKKSRLPKGAKSKQNGKQAVPNISMSSENESIGKQPSGKAFTQMTTSSLHDSAPHSKEALACSRPIPSQGIVTRPENALSLLKLKAGSALDIAAQQRRATVKDTKDASETKAVGASKDLATRLKELAAQRGVGDASDSPPTLATSDPHSTRATGDASTTRESILQKGSSSNIMDDRPKMSTKTTGPVNRSDIMTDKLLGLQSGQKLLDQLLPSSTRRLLDAGVTKTQKVDVKPGMYGVEDKVLVHGHRLTYRPIRHFNDAKFADNVKKVWEREECVSPRLIQAYVWPVVNRGRHVVALSPAGNMYAYLFPLVSALLNEKGLYSCRPSGMGPLVVVLTASWRKAVAVYDETTQLVGERRDLQVLLVHGGGQEENKSFSLINGCHILVTTAPSLKRVLAARFTDLTRLCHLVIDDADDVLENFVPEVRKIMQEFFSVIDNHDNIPRQILLFGSQWNLAIERFMTCLSDPVVVITSMFEAAIYGKVKQVTHMCAPDQKLRQLTGLLEGIADNTENRTIIFSSRKAEIIKLQQVLQNLSYYCMMVHQDMDLFQVHHVLEQWNTNMRLLVCCDEQISEMWISNATHVIHYDLPNSKTKFGNRFATMRQYFQDFSSNHERKVEPTAHMIVGQDCKMEAKSIMELLKRSNNSVPVLLKSIYAGIQAGKQDDEDKPLCNQLLAYGICRNKWRCPDRHLVLPDIDHPPESNWIPDEGQVKVLVTQIVDASHYYVRLMGTRAESGTSQDLTDVYASLEMDIGLWYSDYKHQIRHTAPFAGEVCGYQEKDNFYRVQILDILEMNTRHDRAITGIVAEVKFVDNGREEQVPAHKLYVLPQDLKVVPFQAVMVFVCRVRPVDSDTDWTHQSNMFVYKLLHGKTLDGRVVLRLGHTLWLDPLVERLTSDTGEVRLTINRSYIHTEILRNELAAENPKHLERLYRLCKGKVNVSKALQRKTKVGLIMHTDVLPAVKAYHDVHVSSVAHPGLFYVQRKENTEDLEELMAEINTMMARFEVDEEEQTENTEHFTVGKYVIAEYTSYDGRWYRGQILKVEEDAYEIFFADYGDRDSVRKDKVRLVPKEEFYDFALQAIECKLADIQPTGADWDDGAGDVLWDLSHFINGDLRHFIAKVVTTEAADYADRSRFVVEMVNRHSGEELNLGQELVWRQLAALQESTGLTELFERPSHYKKFYKSPLEKVPEMCSSLYWEQDPSHAVDMAERLKNLLSHSLPSSVSQPRDDVTDDSTMPDALVRLVGRVKWNRVHAIILDCVVMLARATDRLCEELISGELIVYLLQCLSQNSDTKIQHQAADTMARLAVSSHRFKTKFEDQKFLQMLQELFEATPCEQVQGAVCRAFTALCTGSESVYDFVVKMSISQKLARCLTQSADHQVAEAVIMLFSSLAIHDSSHADLKRESVIEAIVKHLDRTKCNQCINESIQLCDNYAAMRRKHKTFLLEQEMVKVLNSKLELELSATTRQLCKDLLSSLVVKVPSEPRAGLRMDGRAVSTPSGVQPDLRWSQNTFRTMLKVRVDNASDTPDLVRFTDNAIRFRAVVGGILHSFDYELYDKILPQKCHVKVTPSEVAISVEKVTKGKWPRLLHRKDKPTNLSVDYENFVDSSDSEVNDEDRPFVLKAKEKKKKMAGVTGKASGGADINLVANSGADTSDSLENAEDYEAKDRYDLFG